MVELFADLPEATDNSVEIALRCAYRPPLRKPILPRFSLPGGETVDEEAELRRQAAEGLETLMARFGLAPGFAEDDYRKRLDFELSVIVRMKFPGYFLIVSDFIKWAKAQDIPSAPAAAPAPARWSPMRSRSPTSTRCASACCSSASSTPSACRCPTSTSTSARSGATR